MGKRRIEIEKIEDRKKMNVTFTKRRQGLFKKADQLSRLCNAQIAILVFSNSGNPYVYGNLDQLTQQYFSNSPSSSSSIATATATATAIDIDIDHHIVNNNNTDDNNGLYYWEENDLNSELMDLTNYVAENNNISTDHLIPTITTTTTSVVDDDSVNGLCFSEEENNNNQVVNSETLMMMGSTNFVDNQLDSEEETAGLEEHQQLCFSIDDFDFEFGTDGSANYDHCNNMVAAASSICNDLLNPYHCVNVEESNQDETYSHDQHSYLSPWDVGDEEFAMLLSLELQYDQCCLFPTD